MKRLGNPAKQKAYMRSRMHKKKKGSTPVKQLAHEELVYRVSHLRLVGTPPAKIAKMLNLSLHQVDAFTREAMYNRRSAVSYLADELREVEDARLDMLLTRFLPQAVKEGDAQAAKVVLGASQRRAALHGLDRKEPERPININISSLDDATLETIRLAVEGAKAKALPAAAPKMLIEGSTILPEKVNLQSSDYYRPVGIQSLGEILAPQPPRLAEYDSDSETLTDLDADPNADD